MKLKNFGDGAWGFAVLAEHEAKLRESVPTAADPAGGAGAEQRLYQPPLDDPSEEDEPFLDDWEEFVSAEFRGEFAAAVAVVGEDLKQLKQPAEAAEEMLESELDNEREERGIVYSLEIPVEHAESWFSALNQARLVLAARYGLFNSEGEEAISVSWEGGHPVAAVDAGTDNPHPPEERVHAYFRSQAFGFIQEWLVSNVLSRGL